MAEPEPPGARRGAGRSTPSSAEAAHHAALDFLARRSHFEIEIERKLRLKGFENAHVRAALERLRRAGLVDDRRSAVEFIAARLRRSPQGRRRLRADLERRGVAAKVVAAALAEALPDGEGDLARDAASRFQRRRRGADPRALQRHLDRMGFSTRDILALSEEPSDLEPPDDGS